MTTLAIPDFVASIVLVAVTDTVLGVGGLGGALKTPDDEIVPRVLFPPNMPLTDQVTVVEKAPVPETVATKVCEVPAATLALAGATVTDVIVG